MRQAIEDFRLERKIPYLLHFTREENIPSIMCNGLVPRSNIGCGGVYGLTNDEMRLDGRMEYNCTSISFPNSSMFYRFKSDHPGSEWPILVIHPIMMARTDSLFCWQNAASTEISKAASADLQSLESFKGLFLEKAGYPNRVDQFLKDCDPTNVQAEVLIPGTIPPKAIYSVIFPSTPCQRKYADVIGDRQSIVSDRRGYYGTRQYYRQWGYGK